LPLKERHTLPERHHLPVIGRRADDGHNAAQLTGDGREVETDRSRKVSE
jgi:hypothetical protein